MLENVRSIPRRASDRVLGEGDRCLREKKTKKIYAWDVGTSAEEWQMLKEKYDGYESVGYYDTVKQMVV